MLDSGKIEPFLISLAEVLEVDPGSLDENTTFEQIDWDSLAIISSIALIDEHFNIMIPGSNLENCDSINNLLSLINNHLSN
tara:strand:+ start:177 stop:419 length:243 start_codon:yes stop_codon:yes gene_type:complete